MGTFEGPADGGDRDDREHEEGFYTETDPEAPELRTVHGQYTETEEGAPDPLIEGEYTGSDLNEEVVDASAEQGDYTDRDE
ncbi:MAG TPA: hypothetical protein VGI08_07720 [Diaminobutyricibacter sp.]|uniref:hypothetical protein n=1 Tax=Leifsonia sp. McL0618 TaxID=3415677 RepID=UPI0033813946